MLPSEQAQSPKVSNSSVGRQRRVKNIEMSKVQGASRIVAYLPSLKTVLLRLRATSATPSSLSSTLLNTATPINTSSSYQAWPHPHDHHRHSQHSAPTPLSAITAHLSLHPSLPLPGAVGVATHETTPPLPPQEDDTANNPATHRVGVAVDTPTARDQLLECVAQSIPEFLLAELMQLFPGATLQGEGLNVITLSQQTVNDMTSWSSAVEQEREQLLEQFVDSAKEICSRLTGAGYWADFVDPSSGRAYYSAYSNATLFETDDRFRYFGFDVIDLGCCKCIHHPVWGAFTFVGVIFTSAPTHSSVIQTIMEL